MVVLLLLIVFVPQTSAEAQTQTTRYVAGHGVVTIWCDGETHRYVPQEYDPDRIVDNPIGWLVSGEPECAFADVLNEVQEMTGESRSPWGYGGAVHAYTDAEAGTLATASTEDTIFGPSASFLTLRADGPDWGDAAEGCGTQSILLPIPPPTTQPLPVPQYRWWAFVESVGVDDELTTCFATTGHLQATWGA